MTLHPTTCAFNALALRVFRPFLVFAMVLSALAVGPLPARAQDNDQLQKRVQQLEQQLVDMQVVIGTLESLAGGPGARASASSNNAAAGSFGLGPSSGVASRVDNGRLDSMETQIRALSAQIEQLSGQMQQLSTGRRQGSIAPPGSVDASSSYASTGTQYGGATAQQAPALGGGFGSTTVTPANGGLRGSVAGAEGDPIGGLLSDADIAAAPSSRGWTSSGADQVARAPLGGGDPKSIYETAYGYLLQQDYTSAETAFGDFVNRFPKDKLASNAQYWLGETYFVRGQYKSAAGAFLKGYEDYRSGSKAPDSLLKLAMSLERLGQKDAACSSLSELTIRFPQAPAHVKRKAQTESQRFRC